MKGKYIANVDDIRPQFRTDQNAFLSQNAIFNSTLVRSNGLGADATIDQLSGQRLDEVSGFKEEALPAFSDQILPFDITLAGTNELGAATCMKIFGVEILNEGSGVSIDDAVTEMQATFVARYVEPWPFRPSSSRRRVKIFRARARGSRLRLLPGITRCLQAWTVEALGARQQIVQQGLASLREVNISISTRGPMSSLLALGCRAFHDYVRSRGWKLLWKADVLWQPRAGSVWGVGFCDGEDWSVGEGCLQRVPVCSECLLLL